MNIVSRQCIRIFRNDLTQQNQCFIFGRALAYKSAISLDKLYPTSNLKLYTPTFVPEDPNAKFNGYIPLEQIDITYSRSSGPGGQHVNRTNTKVDLKSKLTREGYLVIKSELTRSQQLNLADALEKLRTMIRNTTKPPPEVSPETLEMKRKQKLKAARERVFKKRMHSEIKNARNSPVDF
ncbi:peptidyl-tRNA hydrolase ICT1, mitochondrial isoform X2 [Colletes gigas]|uniref:peptidyl-tRNA hydrolase ICT1, mitochondrial isoform X2 n=1 Tax=Colletes gigas TaxID=935657 RepID=UPI001C9AE853|nr:peptidyl-tRNA hydrolase ICT1, mitochondrial isoform X2 [Colletes gigas]